LLLPCLNFRARFDTLLVIGGRPFALVGGLFLLRALDCDYGVAVSTAPRRCPYRGTCSRDSMRSVAPTIPEERNVPTILGDPMLKRIIWIGIAACVLVAGNAQARDVQCGEACDTEMNQCTSKCEGVPKGMKESGKDHKSDDKYMDCWNVCAKTVFHPCLDACKMPKPAGDKE
jgi:hypothetical protein